jgi:hypothetical protein
LMGRMSLYLWFAFLALGSVVAWDTNRIEDQNLRVLAKRKRSSGAFLFCT